MTAEENTQTVISIHAPRTGSDLFYNVCYSSIAISIHAPRTGSDRTLRNLVNIVNSFQSTLPARGATAAASRTAPAATDFNPRSPHGERRQHYDRTRYHLLFQSTLPARGATYAVPVGLYSADISIHAPRTGSDWVPRRKVELDQEFQSTLPARGATTAKLCVKAH